MHVWLIIMYLVGYTMHTPALLLAIMAARLGTWLDLTLAQAIQLGLTIWPYICLASSLDVRPTYIAIRVAVSMHAWKESVSIDSISKSV